MPPAVSSLDAQWIGQQIGGFHVLRLLGKGAMGAVFLAEDDALKRKVALKLLPKGDDETDRERFERFLREARSAARIIHPNVVQVFQIGESDEHRYIAMEYVDGMTLRDYARMQGGRLTQDYGIERFIEAADALRFAANLGICHRDLKPQNLLLTRHNRLKIADFGLAAQVDGGESIGRGIGGQIEGTPGYMSPEQWGDGELTPASDIYGIGCAFFRLFAGRAPYKATDLVGYLRAHCGQTVPDVRVFAPDLHPSLAELLLACMAKSAAERPTAEELHARLSQIAQLFLGTSMQSVETNMSMASPPRRRSVPPPLPKSPPRPKPSRSAPPQKKKQASDHLQKLSASKLSQLPRNQLPSHPNESVVLPTQAAPHRKADLESSSANAPRAEPQEDGDDRSARAVTQTRAEHSHIQVEAFESTNTSYRERYGFRAYPFSDIRQPDYYWDGGPYSDLLGNLSSGLGAGMGLQLLLGEAGSGKTFACEVLSKIHSHFHILSLEPDLLFGATFLQRACREQGIPLEATASERIQLATLLSHTQKKHSKGLVLVIDGLRAEHGDVLAQVQGLLTIIDPRRVGLILTATPSFLRESAETSPSFAATAQQIEPIQIRGMSREEVQAYIRFRLTHIGGVEHLHIDDTTIAFLHARSGGMPRLINVFCHNALTFGSLRREPPFAFHAMRLALKSRSYLTPQTAAAILADSD